MKDDIKKILDIYSVGDRELNIDYIDKLGIKKEYEDISNEALLDYITNLQEEMEKLRSDYIGEKLKIDRAKQYIENHRIREKSIVDVDVLEGILNE